MCLDTAQPPKKKPEKLRRLEAMDSKNEETPLNKDLRTTDDMKEAFSTQIISPNLANLSELSMTPTLNKQPHNTIFKEFKSSTPSLLQSYNRFLTVLA